MVSVCQNSENSENSEKKKTIHGTVTLIIKTVKPTIDRRLDLLNLPTTMMLR